MAVIESRRADVYTRPERATASWAISRGWERIRKDWPPGFRRHGLPWRLRRERFPSVRGPAEAGTADDERDRGQRDRDADAAVALNPIPTRNVAPAATNRPMQLAKASALPGTRSDTARPSRPSRRRNSPPPTPTKNRHGMNVQSARSADKTRSRSRSRSRSPSGRRSRRARRAGRTDWPATASPDSRESCRSPAAWSPTMRCARRRPRCSPSRVATCVTRPARKPIPAHRPIMEISRNTQFRIVLRRYPARTARRTNRAPASRRSLSCAAPALRLLDVDADVRDEQAPADRPTRTWRATRNARRPCS